jgi:hypothetical protein
VFIFLYPLSAGVWRLKSDVYSQLFVNSWLYPHFFLALDGLPAEALA